MCSIVIEESLKEVIRAGVRWHGDFIPWGEKIEKTILSFAVLNDISELYSRNVVQSSLISMTNTFLPATTEDFLFFSRALYLDIAIYHTKSSRDDCIFPSTR